MHLKAYETIEKFKMLFNTNLVVVGVSGGADSIALLHFTKEICNKSGIKIIAAHVNHGIRG